MKHQICDKLSMSSFLKLFAVSHLLFKSFKRFSFFSPLIVLRLKHSCSLIKFSINKYSRIEFIPVSNRLEIFVTFWIRISSSVIFLEDLFSNFFLLRSSFNHFKHQEGVFTLLISQIRHGKQFSQLFYFIVKIFLNCKLTQSRSNDSIFINNLIQFSNQCFIVQLRSNHICEFNIGHQTLLLKLFLVKVNRV